MNHTFLCLPSRSWYSFTDPELVGLVVVVVIVVVVAAAAGEEGREGIGSIPQDARNLRTVTVESLAARTT